MRASESITVAMQVAYPILRFYHVPINTPLDHEQVCYNAQSVYGYQRLLDAAVSIREECRTQATTTPVH